MNGEPDDILIDEDLAVAVDDDDHLAYLGYERGTENGAAAEGAAAVAAGPIPLAPAVPLLPPILPIQLPASGLYAWTPAVASPSPGRLPAGPVPLLPLSREELRLDVDGRYPQRVASGTIFRPFLTRVHWIAWLTPAGTNTWTGTIWYKDGAVATFPYTNVRIRVNRSLLPNARRATVTFSGGGGGVGPTRTYSFRSAAFRSVEFEFDAAAGTTPVTEIQTHDHPNRPPGMASETLTVDRVFQRAGFAVSHSGGGGSVPISGAGANARWSDIEMHDAMQTYWSRFSNTAQWSMWTFFAALHEQGASLGGIMFDDIGPNHRQGTAIFENAFIANPPPGDPAPAAWVRRMRFWTAVHEMGHAFNLAHSWQKSLGAGWIPLSDEPEARSFMNYPYNVAGGQTAFFSDFDYRFSDAELLFLRHAPERFVQMGNADWFDHHGFEEVAAALDSPFRLEMRVHRGGQAVHAARLQFLEPALVEVKLENVSEEPQIVPDQILNMRDRMTIVIKKKGSPASLFRPYVQYCWKAHNKVLNPGEAVYEALFLSAGQGGWEITEPGDYTLQMSLRMGDGTDLVSNALTLRVEPPLSREEEYVAPDYFTDAVGRVLRLNGSRFFDGANDTLRDIADRLPERRVALHAELALGNAEATPYKELVIPANVPATPVPLSETEARFQVRRPDLGEATRRMEKALDDAGAAADSLGHIEMGRSAEVLADSLAQAKHPAEAGKMLDRVRDTFAAHGVLPSVLKQIDSQKKALDKKG